VTPEVAEALTRPVVAAALAVVIVLVLVAADAMAAPVVVVHEGAHMAVGSLTGLEVRHFQVKPDGNAATYYLPWRWGPGRILTTFAGYVTPSLVGLAGAALLVAGKAWPLLWTAVVLLVLAGTKARGDIATSVVLLLAAAIGYVALYGAPALQAGFAAGVVWLLLVGGLRDTVIATTDASSDAGQLARDTLIPALLWKAAFVVIALLCLLKGTRLLLSI
jgi:hypothetical protein